MQTGEWLAFCRRTILSQAGVSIEDCSVTQPASHAIERAIDEFIRLRVVLLPHTSSQTILLIDMVLLELGRQLAAMTGGRKH